MIFLNGQFMPIEDAKIPVLGSAPLQGSMVSIYPGSFRGPLLLKLVDTGGGQYWDESTRQWTSLQGVTLHAMLPSLTHHVSINPLTEAAYQYALARVRGEPALPMNRFRPNLVVRGLPPFAEDHLSTLRIGDVELTPVKPCVRCQVTTTDQATAAVGIEPLRTLGGFRMDERFGGVTFGMNAVVTAGAGARIASGDTVTADYRF